MNVVGSQGFYGATKRKTLDNSNALNRTRMARLEAPSHAFMLYPRLNVAKYQYFKSSTQ